MVPRHHHTAALLADGRVLVAGGSQTDEWSTEGMRSAEVYDPAAGRSTATGNMSRHRARAAMVTLADGRVMVSGGIGPGVGFTHLVLSSGMHRSVEIWDRASGKWRKAARLRHARMGHRMIALADGRVLAIGGSTLDEDADFAIPIEEWDPRADRWREAFPGTAGSDGPVARLGDGRVFIAQSNGSVILDPATDRFVRVVAAPFHPTAAVAIDGGKVVVVGHDEWADEDNVRRTFASVWDPASGAFSAPVPARASHLNSSVATVGGRVLVLGGSLQDRNPVVVESFDPATHRWSREAELSVPVVCPPAIARGAEVLLVGGLTPGEMGEDGRYPPALAAVQIHR